MPLRDLALFGILAVGVPLILAHPWIGVIYWVCIGLMSPHRLSWGPAYDFQFALAFVVWFSFTTLFAFNPDRALPMLERALKVQVMVFVTLLLFNERRQLELLVWTIALSIG